MSFPAYPTYKDSGSEWIGTIPDHWPASPLKRAFEIEGGSTPTPDEVNWDGDIAWVTPADLSGLSSLFLDSSKRTITATGLASCGSTLLPAGSLILSTRAPIGSLAIALTSMCTNQGCKGLVPNENASAVYFAFVLLTAIDELKNRGRGSTFLEISGDELSRFSVPTPPFAEQIKIARFLDHETVRIDALIDEQQRLIELLKEKRQAMISLAVTKGLDPTVPMKDSGVEWLGEVPEHWEVKQLKHVVDPNTSITYGIVQAGPEFEGGIPYIRTSDMSGEALPISGYPLTSPEIDESYARSRVRPGDIVMSIRASVGKCLPVPDELKVANLTQGTAKISPGQGVTRNFLLAFLNAEAAQNYFELMAKGATFKEITLDALRRTPVLLPPVGEQIKIDQFVARHAGLLNETCKQAIQSVSLLQERRSALISAAVTGKIDVRDWQPAASAPSPELVEEAV